VFWVIGLSIVYWVYISAYLELQKSSDYISWISQRSVKWAELSRTLDNKLDTYPFPVFFFIKSAIGFSSVKIDGSEML
jgi:hypothetical protein